MQPRGARSAAALALLLWQHAAAELAADQQLCERKCAAAGHCCQGLVASHNHPSCAAGCVLYHRAAQRAGEPEGAGAGGDAERTARCTQLCKDAEGARCVYQVPGTDLQVRKCEVCPGECDASLGPAECEEGCRFADGAPMPTPAPPTPQPTYAPGWEAKVERVHCVTTKGDIDIDVHPEWAPEGAAHFLTLVRDGYWTDIPFCRVNGAIIQFGERGRDAPVIPSAKTIIKDDPKPFHQRDNKMMLRRGELSYAGAGKNTRGSSIFFVTKPNRYLGQEHWEVPFAEVQPPGMDVVDAIYSGYGDLAFFGCSTCHGPDWQRLFVEGNAYLRREFPKLDYLVSCRVVPRPGAIGGGGAEAAAHGGRRADAAAAQSAAEPRRTPAPRAAASAAPHGEAEGATTPSAVQLVLATGVLAAVVAWGRRSRSPDRRRE
eukprot:TRINITY_DN28263_c0_g1_i1.p1 TRINITY_DN28263_c0_g1~~TRINITY_DN28263_c0_g1_i1.p1  ORF type:complete len:454 (+),score=127.98 TRINITY_DN28263_c0_g1_i1:71-1363(+)